MPSCCLHDPSCGDLCVQVRIWGSFKDKDKVGCDLRGAGSNNLCLACRCCVKKEAMHVEGFELPIVSNQYAQGEVPRPNVAHSLLLATPPAQLVGLLL